MTGETAPGPATVHATALVLEGTGIAIRGASGSGKSRLALALLQAAGCQPTREPGSKTMADSALIGDDYIALLEGKPLAASPAPNLAGRMEVRGLGLIGMPWRERAPLHLVVDLVPLDAMERLPESRTTELDGHALPGIQVPIGDLAHQMVLVRATIAVLVR